MDGVAAVILLDEVDKQDGALDRIHSDQDAVAPSGHLLVSGSVGKNLLIGFPSVV